MSMPTIPDITPNIDLDIEDCYKMLLNSLALQEMGLSHIVNAEGEKLQYVIQALTKKLCKNPSHLYLDKVLCVNNSIDKVLRDVLKNQMILQMKMEDTMDLYSKINGCDCLKNECDEHCSADINDDIEECYNKDEVKCEAVHLDTDSKDIKDRPIS